MTIRLIFALVLLAGAVSAAGFEEPENWAQVLYDELSSGRPLPNLTAIDPSIDVEDAYRIQRYFTGLRHAQDAIAGYRAGMTGVPPAQQYKLRQPMIGALFASGALQTHAVIDLQAHPRLMIECAVGFVVARDITAPLAADVDLRALIREVRPVIELPSLYFESPDALTVPDLVMGEGGGRLYIQGEPLALADPAAANGLFVELARGDRVVDRGRGSNVMGDQLLALRALINGVLARGYRIEAGQLLLTGALGDSIPAEPGLYQARFRDVGNIDFTINEGDQGRF